MADEESKKKKKIAIQDIGDIASSFATGLLKKGMEAVPRVSKEGDDWKVIVEVLERKAIPDTQDILGVYELKLAEDGELKEYKRVELRRRGDVGVEDVED